MVCCVVAGCIVPCDVVRYALLCRYTLVLCHGGCVVKCHCDALLRLLGRGVVDASIAVMTTQRSGLISDGTAPGGDARIKLLRQPRSSLSQDCHGSPNYPRPKLLRNFLLKGNLKMKTNFVHRGNPENVHVADRPRPAAPWY